MASNNQVNQPFPLAISAGGTGVTSVTTAPTSSAWSGWDANKNYSAVGFIPGYTTTVTSASPVTLTVGSNQQQYFTGSTAQTLTMPVATTLVVGQYWSVINNSSAVVTIQSSGSNTILALPANSETVVTCVTASGTSAASWTTSPALSGSGTVNSGLINQLAWYSASGTAVSGLATANSSGLLTNSSGVPAWVTATGTGAPVLGTAPTISAPKINQINDQTQNLPVIKISSQVSAVNQLTVTNGATGVGVVLQATGTDTNIPMALEGTGTGGVGIKGTGTNDNAASGYVGEYITATSTGVSMSNNGATDLASISLTAGDWDVFGNVYVIPTGISTYVLGWSSLASATAPSFPLYNAIETAGSGQTTGFNVPYLRVSITTTTTVYLGAQCGFSTGTCTGYGNIFARRVR